MITLTLHGLGAWFSLAMWIAMAVAVPYATYRLGKSQGDFDSEAGWWERDEWVGFPDSEFPPYPRRCPSETVTAEEFVRAVQARRGIAVDGVVGPQTWNVGLS